MSTKIKNALPELVENGIITTEIAQNIIAYYDRSKEENSNRLFTIFGIIGATLVGLGIILIMAHNWDTLPRFVKLILAFLPMLLGQAALGYSILKNKENTWKEAATVFLFFSVGACIALVSQIYHIPGAIESFLLMWICLCLPLLYVTKSKAIIFLHLIFCTYYAMVTGYERDIQTSPFLYFVLLAIGIPRYVQLAKQKIPSAATYILHWLFPASIIIALPICVQRSPQITYFLYMCLFGFFLNIGYIPYFKNKSLLQNGYKVIGTLGTIVLLLIVSFHDIWSFSFSKSQTDLIEIISAFSIFILASLVFSLNNYRQKFLEVKPLQVVFLIFTVIFLLGPTNTGFAVVLINMLLFGLGILHIKMGVDKVHFGYLNLGMFIIAALIVCRFYDTDINFAIRGIIFLIIGIGFFITNYIMLKKQKTQQ